MLISACLERKLISRVFRNVIVHFWTVSGVDRPTVRVPYVEQWVLVEAKCLRRGRDTGGRLLSASLSAATEYRVRGERRVQVRNIDEIITL